MSSTNKTTHLRLNQWIGSDPVLRTDFNFDNSRIDAAVNARSMVRLTGKTLSADAGTIVLDLADQDLTGYAELQLILAPVTSATAAVTLKLDQSAAVELATVSTDGTRGLKADLLLLPGGVGGWWMAPGGTGTTSGTFQAAGLEAENLTTVTLALSGAATYRPGTTCTLYGITK